VSLERGVRLCALLDVALAVWLLFLSRPSKQIRAFVAATSAALVLWFTLGAWRYWDKQAITAGIFRVGLARHSLERGGVLQVGKILYYRDGVSTTVSIEGFPGDKLALKNNGKVEASSVGDMATQVLVGLLPVLLHGGADQKVVLIGYGSGITAGSIAVSPDVASLDVVELEPAIYEAADQFFSIHNNRPQDNPKVKRWVGDGRNFLTSRDEMYDVIVSEPSNPWIAGVASLFTREFYAFAKRHLAPGGIVCQWAQLYELGPSNVKAIYKTFHEAFPYVYAFTTEDTSADTILIGTLEPLPLRIGPLEERVRVPEVWAELQRGRVRDPLDLPAMIILGPGEVEAFAAGGAINTDDNALIEFSAPRDLLSAGQVERFANAIFSAGWPYGHLGDVLQDFGEGAVGAERELRLAKRLLAHGRRREAAVWLGRATTHGAAADEVKHVERLRQLVAARAPHEELALDAGGPPRPPPAADWFHADVPLAEREAAVKRVVELYHLAEATRWKEAVEVADALPQRASNDGGNELRLLRAYVYYQSWLFSYAADELAPLAYDWDWLAKRPATIYYYGRSLYGNEYFRSGLEQLERFARGYPALIPAVEIQD
jgi:hypothetical protein